MNESNFWQREDRGKHVQVDYPSMTVTTNNVTQVFNVGRSRSGVSNPRWREIIRNGGNATTIFNGTRVTATVKEARTLAVSPPSIDGTYRVQTYEGVPWFLNRNPSNPFTIGSVTAKGLASVYFLNRLRETRSQTMGGVMLGEARETMKMLLNPAKTLRAEIPKYFNSLSKRKAGALRKSTAKSLAVRRREDLKRAAQLKRIAADTWLEYSFGWKPLMMDIHDTVRAIGRLGENSFQQKISSKGRQEGVEWAGGSNEGYITTGPNMLPLIIWHVSEVKEVDVYIRGATKVQTWTSPAAKNNALFGFNLEQFVPTLWELIPWSFFVDYFTNIGDILSSAFTSTSNLAWTCTTSRGRTYIRNGAKLSPNNGSWAVSLDPGKLEFERTVIERDASGPVVPSLRFSLPGSNTQWVNIAALFSGHKSLIPFHK